MSLKSSTLWNMRPMSNLDIKVRWEKTDDYEPTRYYDMNGNEIELNTGKTYIAIIQEGKAPSFKINPDLKDRVEE